MVIRVFSFFVGAPDGVSSGSLPRLSALLVARGGREDDMALVGDDDNGGLSTLYKCPASTMSQRQQEQ